MAKSYLLWPEAKTAILKNITFIWKYERPDDEFASGEAAGVENLVLAKWMPQNDLLAHSSLSLFITHGGMGSVQELTLRGVPAILVPIFADQPRNAAMIEYNGMGKDKNYIADDVKLSALVKELLENERYGTNARRTAEMLAYKPFSSRELLLKHVDFAARFGPSRALRPQSIDMNWIEYYNVDAILVAIIVVSLILIGISSSVVLVISRFVGQRKQKYE
ncbi:hypothetical protein PMAYCL1PPCAC_15404, partial [Pristionchus mayeri]